MRRPPLTFAFFGSSLVSAYWNGAATYYRGVLRALAARGHSITFYEPDAYERQAHRDIPDPPWAKVVVYSGTDEREPVRLVHEASRTADVLVKASGVGVFDAILEAAVLDARRPGQAVVFWDVDAAATLERVESDPTDPFRALIAKYDYVLAYGGGEPVIRGYGRHGARACVPIYNALDPDTHHPVPPDGRFAADLSLLANRLPDREARVDEFFFRAAAALPQHTFILGGSGWNDKPMPPSVRYAGHVYTQDHNAFNTSARMVLNVARDSMAKIGFSPATRVFEAAGAGACLITDAWEGIELFLEPGREVLVARDGAEVAEYTRSVSATEARAIGEAARKRVNAEHTYALRARQVETLFATRASASAVEASP